MKLVDTEYNVIGNIQSECIMQKGDTVFVDHNEYVVVDIVHRITAMKYECEIVLNKVLHKKDEPENIYYSNTT